jgi:heme/copper-type cytochrome/quinol oxidase subunit 2
MASKDQAIGAVIFIVCAIVGIFYVVTLFYPRWLNDAGLNVDVSYMSQVQFWIIAIPVLVAFIAIMGIGAWIGWTMATTPPPKPIEEITAEMEIEEKKTTEEKPVEEEAPKEETKKTEKKKTEK